MSIRNHIVEWLGLIGMVAKSDNLRILNDLGKWLIFAALGWWIATMQQSGRQQAAIEACTKQGDALESRLQTIEQHGAPSVQRELAVIRQELRENRTLIIEHMNQSRKGAMQGP